MARRGPTGSGLCASVGAMRLSLRRRPTEPVQPGIIATARVDARTRELPGRLRPGDIAVIDHVDLDRGAALALAAARPAAVVNAAFSISGRFPALGAQTLVDAGIPLVDGAGPELFTLVGDGARVRLDGSVLYVADQALASGVLQTSESLALAADSARAGLGVQLEAFTAAAAELLRREHALFLDATGAPQLDVALAGRPVVIVAEGPTAAAELRALRRFIRDRRPVLIGVETGADVLRASRLHPAVVVGDFERVSDAALQSGAELVLHSRHTTRPPGEVRSERLAVRTVSFPYAGRSEDAAILLARHSGASVVILAGGPEGLVAALDSGRTGMASTFLTRLQAGDRLVPAQAAAALHRRERSSRLVAVLLACQLGALATAVAVDGGPAQAATDVRHAVSSTYHRALDTVEGR